MIYGQTIMRHWKHAGKAAEQQSRAPVIGCLAGSTDESAVAVGGTVAGRGGASIQYTGNI